jgi:hypothetical protein
MDLGHDLHHSVEATPHLAKRNHVHPEDPPDTRINASSFVPTSQDTHIPGSPTHGQSCGDGARAMVYVESPTRTGTSVYCSL